MNPGTRTRDKERHREQILEAMEGLLSEKEYATITIREIARRARVSVGLIYKNFPGGRSGIIKELVSINIETALPPAELRRFDSDSTREYIKNAIVNLVRAHGKNQALNQALEAACMEEPGLNEFFADLVMQELSPMYALLGRLRDENIINIPRLESWGPMLVQMVDAMIHRRALHPEMAIGGEKELVEFLDYVVERCVLPPV